MDAALTVLLQAATLIGNAAIGETTKRAVGQAWDITAGAIKRRFGADHPAPALLDSLRSAAGNDIRMATIQAQLQPLHLGQDPEVLAAIEGLAAAIQQQGQSTVNIYGTINGAGVVHGGQTIHFGK